MILSLDLRIVERIVGSRYDSSQLESCAGACHALMLSERRQLLQEVYYELLLFSIFGNMGRDLDLAVNEKQDIFKFLALYLQNCALFERTANHGQRKLHLLQLFKLLNRE